MVSLADHLLHYAHEVVSLILYTITYYVVLVVRSVDFLYFLVGLSYCDIHIPRFLFWLDVPRYDLFVCLFVVYHSFATFFANLWSSLKFLDFHSQFHPLLWTMIYARSRIGLIWGSSVRRVSKFEDLGPIFFSWHTK